MSCMPPSSSPSMSSCLSNQNAGNNQTTQTVNATNPTTNLEASEKMNVDLVAGDITDIPFDEMREVLQTNSNLGMISFTKKWKKKKTIKRTNALEKEAIPNHRRKVELVSKKYRGCHKSYSKKTISKTIYHTAIPIL